MALEHGSASKAAMTDDRNDPFQLGRRIGRIGAVVVAVLFGGGLLWLNIAPLSSAVVVPSTVVVENYRTPVQHLEGGIVSAVLVRSGDRVERGQVLLQLEAVQVDAGVQSLQDQLDAELARSQRADAERLMRAPLVFPEELVSRARASSKTRSLMDAEAELFAARRRQWQGQTALLRNQAEQVQAEAQGLRAQIAAAGVSRRLLEQELEMNRDLQRREFVQQTRVMVFERALADKDERRGEHDVEMAKAQQKLLELDLKVISLQDEYVKRASDEYAEANRRVLDLRERLRPLTRALARQSVEAPVSGQVVGLRVNAAGAVIGAGDLLMEIVPDQPKLLVEGKVRPEDVADLRVGQAVTIQIMAFKQRNTPMLDGRLTYLSADSMAENVSGQSIAHYQIQASVDPESLKAMPRDLSPGMPATMFIETAPRTALEYLLQPLTDALRRSFVEP